MTEFDKLVIRAQQGNKTEMNTVVKYMYKAIYAKMQKTWQELPGGHALEDIVQFAMIEVYDAIKTYNGKGSAINWIWLHAQSEISLQARYLNYNKRKANMGSSSLDKPLNTGNKNIDENITLASVLPCGANTEHDAISNVTHKELIEYLRKELSELESRVMDYMLLEYPNRDIVTEIGCPNKTVVNAKERIKSKVRKYLAVG